MTTSRRHSVICARLYAAALGLAACWAAPVARAATLTWGTTGTGGSGTWNTTLTNWWTGAAQTTWSNAAPDNAVLAGTAGTLTLSENITAGTITSTVTGYTISATNSSTLTVSTINISSLGQSGQLTVGAQLTGSQPLTLAAAGNTSASGGSDGTLGIYLTNTSNNFTGDVTISSGLVTYANNSVFGNAANKIILTGGGLLDNNTNIALSRAIEVRSGTSTFRTYGSTNVSWSSTVTGSAVVNRTDSGTLNFTGDWSAFAGTYVNQAGTTRFQNAANVISGTLVATGGTLTVENTGSNTIGAVRLSSATLLVRSNSNAFGTATISATNSTIGSQASSTAFTLPNAININGTLSLSAANGSFGLSGPITGSGVTLQTTGATGNAVTLTGSVNLGTGGNLRTNGNNTLTIGAGAIVNADTISVFDGTTTGAILQIDGGSVTTKYMNIGAESSRRGTVNQTSGTVTILSGGAGFRLGHWPNGGNPANQYNLTGGVLDATALSANSGDERYVNVGWDGVATMTVGGGAGLANLKAAGIAIDRGGDHGTMTLIVSNRGLVEVGSLGIIAQGAPDTMVLNSGTVRATAAATWASVISASTATVSTLDAGSVGFTLSNNLTGSGTINLIGSGTVTFDTAGTQTVAPALAGTAPIAKTSAGTTTFSGIYASTSPIAASSGTLQLSGTGSLGNLTANGGTLLYTGTGSFGTVSVSSGSLRLSGSFTSASNVSATGGTLTLSGTGTLGNTDLGPSGTIIAATGANVTVGTLSKGTGIGGTLTIQPGATLTSGSLNNNWNFGAVTVNGTWNNTGGLLFSVANTLTIGGTGTINTNTLRLANFTTLNLGLGRLNVGSGGISNGGTAINFSGAVIGASANWSSSSNFGLTQTTTFNTLDSADGTTPRTISLSGVLSNSGGVVKVNSGTLALSGANSYSGTTTVAGGVLAVTNTLRSTAAVTVTGGTADFNAINIFVTGHGVAVADSMVLTATGAGSTILISGGESRIGNVTLGSGGTLTSNRALSGFDWLMANVSSGTWATLAVTGNAAATMNGTGGLRLQNIQNFNVADVTGNANTDLTVSLILGDPGSSGGTGGLNKSGAGTMAISTQAQYTGGTIIQAGVLDLTGGGGSAGTIRGTATVNAGATLRLSTADATGFGTGSDRLSTINLVGGTMNVNTASNQTLGNATINMTGGFITGTAGSNIDFFQGSSALNTLASSTTSVISGVALSPLRQGSTTFTVASGSTPSGIDLEIQSNMQTTPSGGGDPAGAQFIKAGAGTLRITGSVTYTGTTAVQAGTLQVGGNGTTGSIQAAASVSAGALLAFNRSNAYTYSGSISGAGNVSQIGSGTLTLSGSSSYTGTTTLAAGMLALGNADAIGTTGTISFTGGTLQFSASNTADYGARIKNSSAAILLDTNGQSVTFAGAVDSTNASGLTKLGSGTLSLAAANTYAGNTTISAGVLQLGSGGSTGSVAGPIVNNATLRVNRSDAFTLSNLISGPGALVQAGSGTTTLSGVNTYSGATTVTGGVLAISTDLNLGAAPGSATPGSIVIDGGTLAFTSGFTLAGNRGIALGPAVGSGTGTIDVATGQTIAYGGVIASNGAGTDGLVKAGGGILSLTGAATYTGDTSVNAGTLQIGAGASLASPLVAVASGATLSGGGSVNAVTVADGGILAPGVAGSGTLTTGSLSFAGGGTVTMGIAGGQPTNLLAVLGDVTTLGSGTSVTFAFGANLATITSNTYSLLTYTGTLSDPNAFGYTGTIGGRQTVAISTGVANVVSLVIGNDFPIWTGTNGIGWFASDNWELDNGDIPTNFQTADTVVFNDLATSGTVQISGSNATPASTTFAGNTVAMTLEATGGFGISTGSLIKTGSALVTITNANTFGEGTTLSAGRLRVGDDGALGTGAITVTGPAALSSDGATAHTLANGLHLDADVTLGDATDTGNLTFTGTVTFDGASRTITTPSNVTLSGLVTNGGLTKAGAGVLTITGSNNYANGTTLSAGTLRAGNDAALGAGLVTLADGATLSSDSATARSLTNAVTLTGNVTLGDAANSGALALGAVGGVNLGGGTRQVTTPSNVTFAGPVTNGGLTKAGPGTLTLAVANSYAAGTTVAAGDIALGNVGALGTGTATYAGAGSIGNTVAGTIANAIAVNAGISGTFDSAANATSLSGGIANAGTLTLTTSATQTISGAVSGAGTLVAAGPGALTLTGSNTLTGTVSLAAGRLNLNSAAALGTGSLVITGSSTLDNTSGAAVTLTGPNAQSWNADFAFAGTNPLNLGTGAVTLGGNRQVTVTSSTLTVGGGIGGGFVLTKAGAGTLSLTGAGDYSGGTTLSAGTLLVGNAASLGTGAVALNGGTLTVSGVSVANAVVLGGGTVAGTGGTLAGVISGGSPLNVTGTGALTLSASNTYSGGTELLGGTLNVAAISGIGSGYLAVKNGATFAYTGSGAETTTQTLWLDSGSSTINVSNATGALTWNPAAGTRSGPFTKTGPGALTIGGPFTSGASVTVAAGLLTLTASNSHSGGTTVAGGTLQIGAGGTVGSISGNVAVGSAGTLLFNRSDASSYSGVISGSGAVRQIGTGTTTLGGSNTFSGVLTVAQGGIAVATVNNASANGPLGNSASAVVLGSSGATGVLAYTGATASSTKTFTLATGGTGAFDIPAATTLTLSGAIGGSGRFVKQGAGSLTLTAANTFTGPITIASGTLEVGGSGRLNNGSYAGAIINNGDLLFTTSQNQTLTGSMSGPGGLTWNSGAALFMSGVSTYSGTTTIAGSGYLEVAGGGALSIANSVLNLTTSNASRGLDIWDGRLTVRGLTGSGIVVANGIGQTFSGVALAFAPQAGETYSFAGTINNRTWNSGAVLQIEQAGAGTQILTGSNGFTGGAIITSGTLGFATNGLGSSGALRMNGGTLRWETGNTQDVSSRITLLASTTATLDVGTNNVTLASGLAGGAVSASLLKQGAGTLTLSGNNVYTNTTTIASGTLAIGGSGQLGGGSHAGPIVNAGVLDVATSANQTLSGEISGAGSLVKSGAGALTLPAANTFAGGLSLAAGVVRVGNDAALGSGTARLTGGGLSSDGGTARTLSNPLVFDGNATLGDALNTGLLTFTGGVDLGGATRQITTASDVTIASAITNGGLTKAGAGTLTLSASNSFTGGSTISAGVVDFVAGALGPSGTVAVGQATLRWAAGTTQDISSRLALVDATTATLDIGTNDVTLGSGFGAGSSGGLTKTGAGTLTLTGSNGYTGNTAVTGGTLAIAGGGSIASSGGMNVGPGAALDIAAAAGLVSVGTLTGDGNVTLGGNTLRTTVVGESIAFGGVISGAGGFTKAGSDTLELTSLQSFTGTARVEQGVLVLTSGTAFATASRIYVDSGAILESPGLTVVNDQTLGGYGTVAGDLALLAGGTLSPGGSVGTLSGTAGTTTWNGGMHYLFEVNDAAGTAGVDPGWDLFTTTGGLTLNVTGTDQIFVDLTSLSGTAAGLADGFDPSFNYAWKFVVAGSTIGYEYALNPTWFKVETGAFQNTTNGSFYVARGDQLGGVNASGFDNELYVVYAAVPEPGTLGLAGIGLAAAGLAAARRRLCRAGRSPRRAG